MDSSSWFTGNRVSLLPRGSIKQVYLFGEYKRYGANNNSFLYNLRSQPTVSRATKQKGLDLIGVTKRGVTCKALKKQV